MKYNRSYELVAPTEKSFGKWFFGAAMYKSYIIIRKYHKRQTAHSEVEQIAVDYCNRLKFLTWPRSHRRHLRLVFCRQNSGIACLIKLPRQYRYIEGLFLIQTRVFWVKAP